MARFLIEGLIKAYPGRWGIWTASGSYVVHDYGHVGEGMLTYSVEIDAATDAAAIAEFVSTYFPMNDDGPEVFDEVIARDWPPQSSGQEIRARDDDSA